jgi:hypothetical protein
VGRDRFLPDFDMELMAVAAIPLVDIVGVRGTMAAAQTEDGGAALNEQIRFHLLCTFLRLGRNCGFK